MSLTSPKMRLGRSLDNLKSKMMSSLSPINLDLVYDKDNISKSLKKKSRNMFGRVVKSVKETMDRVNPNLERKLETEEEVDTKHISSFYS